MDNRRRAADDDYEPSTPTQRHSNVFGDEYEIMDVADGFRPDNDIDDDEASIPIHSASAHYASNPLMTYSPDPLSSSRSTRKSRSAENPFEDSLDTHLTRTTSTRSSSNYAPGIAGRPISSASSSRYANTDSQRLGNAGPSHPYTMYPQGTIMRSPSVATTMTTRPDRRTSLRAGPQHPYGMYTQGVADSEDDDDEPTANPVPVGFGLGQTYRRVRGPEGEEQDIIGEYGHAEQLPPYSKYPDDGPEKSPLLAVPEGIHSRPPVEGTDPTMPLMHQQLSRQSRQLSQSMTDASQLEQSAPLLPDNASADTSDGSNISNEKSWKEKNWKERRRHKFCGVKFGWILIGMACAGFIFAVLVGSLVGYMAGVRQRKSATTTSDSSEGATTTLTASFYDASLIPTPSGAGPLPGPFALTLGPAQATQTDCLVNPTHKPAWDCNLAGEQAVVLSIGLPPVAGPTNSAMLFYSSDDTNITYGAQYQFMSTDYSPLIPVKDNDDPNLGPAYFFQSTYNKVVVVPNNTFPSRGKRDFSQQPGWAAEWTRRKQVAPAGDRPWFCFFNNTAIEGFIYVHKPANLNLTASTTAASSATITSSSLVTTTRTTTTPAITERPTNMAAFWSQKIAAVDAAHARTSTIVQARNVEPRDRVKSGNEWANLYPYPSIVKLEERRVANNTKQPYCQQYQILDDGGYNPIVNSQGAPIMFYLDESIPHGAYKDKRASSGGCHCQWMHGVS